jgi:hypothetical protein
MFNAEYRKVMDVNWPMPVRYRRFRHCLEWYCYLTKQSFQATFRRIGMEFGFDEVKRPDEAQLTQAAMLLNKERANFLKKLEAFTAQRIEEKAQGRWQSRKAQVKALYTPDWLETGEGGRPA